MLIDIQNEYFDGPLKLSGVEAAAEVTAGLAAEDVDALFAGTAARVYRL